MSMIKAGNMSDLLHESSCGHVLLCYYGGILESDSSILGQLSLGHAGFMCIGAFTGAFFQK